MASIWPLLVQLLIFMASPSLMLAFVVPTTTLPVQPHELPTSTISAAPALLPDAPLASPPASSPDVTPLFPSPGGSQLSPTESSFPTISSTPSPPNPDAMEAPGPVMAFSPFGSLPFSSSLQLQVSGFLLMTSVLLLPALW